MVVISSRSLDLELSISLAVVAQASSFLAQHIYSLPAYVFIASDYVTVLTVYVHHSWIAAFCIFGSTVHTRTFLIRDYNIAGSTWTLFMEHIVPLSYTRRAMSIYPGTSSRV